MVETRVQFLFYIFEVCRVDSRVTGETTHTHTRMLDRSKCSFSVEAYSWIGHVVTIHLLLQYIDFISTNCLAYHCWKKKNTSKAYYTCVHFTPRQVVLNVSLIWSPSRLQRSLSLCASSCLLNIIGISTGGLIKKQLPLVAVGNAWRGVARLSW